MKLACEVIKAWLVPYSEGSLRAHRPYLHAVVRRHLRTCASCRQDEVLLHRTAMALRRHRTAAAWSLRRGRSKSTVEVPLSSRVLQAIRDERAQPTARPQGSRYPLQAYATAVALLCIVFAVLTQPTGARPWFARYLFNHSQHIAGQAKPAPVTPPYPMHDPFVVPSETVAPEATARPTVSPDDNRADRTAELKASSGGALSSEGQKASLLGEAGLNSVQMRPAAWTQSHSELAQKPFAVQKSPAAAQFDLQAREAMTAAEVAELNRAPKRQVARGVSQPAVPLVVPPVAPTQSVPSGSAPLAPAPAPSTATPGKGQPDHSVPAEFAHIGRPNLPITASPANPIKAVPSPQTDPSSKP